MSAIGRLFFGGPAPRVAHFTTQELIDAAKIGYDFFYKNARYPGIGISMMSEDEIVSETIKHCSGLVNDGAGMIFLTNFIRARFNECVHIEPIGDEL